MHSPALNNDKDPYEVKCHIRAQCGGGVSHWALAHREVTLSHNYGKLKNVIMLDGYKHS